MTRLARLALLVAAALAAGALAVAARADGDPASDTLLTEQVFLPFDVKFPPQKQRQLVGVVAAANRAGYKIRVALIGSVYDLGAVTALWGKPRVYARFLGEELQFVYHERLLVVMPNGFGFNRPKHPAKAEYAVLDKVPIAHGSDGLIDAATTAVQRLAAAGGVEVAAPTTAAPRSTRTRDRLIILGAAVAALVLALEARRLLRRRRAPR